MVNYHQKNHHLGAQALLALVRQNYWPVHGTVIAKKIIRLGVKCFKANPKPKYPLMADLSKHRVVPLRPFSIVGTDFCGPFPDILNEEERL